MNVFNRSFPDRWDSQQPDRHQSVLSLRMQSPVTNPHSELAPESKYDENGEYYSHLRRYCCQICCVLSEQRELQTDELVIEELQGGNRTYALRGQGNNAELWICHSCDSVDAAFDIGTMHLLMQNQCEGFQPMPHHHFHRSHGDWKTKYDVNLFHHLWEKAGLLWLFGMREVNVIIIHDRRCPDTQLVSDSGNETRVFRETDPSIYDT